MVELKIQDYSKNKNIFSDVESTLKNILPQNHLISEIFIIVTNLRNLGDIMSRFCDKLNIEKQEG